MDLSPIQIALALFLASAAGAIPPLTKRWSERGLHLFVALSVGIFLGTIFLHLLPELAGGGSHAGHDHGAHAGEAGATWLGTGAPWIAALAGLLLLFALEKVWLPTVSGRSSNPHVVLWWATFVGLSFHAVTVGFALPAMLAPPEARAQLLVSLLIHKASEVFSLATVMRLAHLPTRRTIAFLFLFALIEPVGYLVGHRLVVHLPSLELLLTGFACGTFLYVAICDLLPEVFHDPDRPWIKLTAVVLGIGITVLTLPRIQGLLEFASATGGASWRVLCMAAPWLLVGLLVAGLTRVHVGRGELVERLRGAGAGALAFATALGVVLRIRAGDATNLARGLRAAGASAPAATTTTQASAHTDCDGIASSAALLDPVTTCIRPMAGLVSSFATGLGLRWFASTRRTTHVVSHGGTHHAHSDAHSDAHDEVHANGPAHVHQHEHAVPHSHAHVHHHVHTPVHGHVHAHVTAPTHALRRDDAGAQAPHDALAFTTQERRGPRLAAALRFAFVDAPNGIAVPLAIGVLLSGALLVSLERTALAQGAFAGWLGVLLATAIGFPVRLAVVGAVPLAAAALACGATPGAALAFLLIAPATDIRAWITIARTDGLRAAAVHALVPLSVAFACGLAALHFDLLAPARLAPALDAAPHWSGVVAAVIVALLVVAALVRVHGRRDLMSALR